MLIALSSGLHNRLCKSRLGIMCLQYRFDGDATDLCLDFSVEDDTFGARSVHSLVPGGSQVAVTDSNKLHYIHLAAEWHLNGRLGASSAAFARGLAQVYSLSSLACAK